MQRSDYILRMIERLGQMLVALRKLIIDGAAPERVRAELRTIAQSGGVDIELARLATPDTLLMFVAPGGEADPTRSWLLAELLYLDALQARSEDRMDAARGSLERALLLFGLVEPGGVHLVGWPEAADRIREITTLLQEPAGP